MCITLIFFHLQTPISSFPLIFAKSPYPFPTPCNAKGVFSFPLCVAVNSYTLATGCIQIKCSPNSETSFSPTLSVRFLTRQGMFSWFSLWKVSSPHWVVIDRRERGGEGPPSPGGGEWLDTLARLPAGRTPVSTSGFPCVCVPASLLRSFRPCPERRQRWSLPG